MLASHDLEDVVNVVEGRPAVVEEVAAAEPSLRTYLARQFGALMSRPDFLNALPGLVAFDELYESRVETVRTRVVAMASLNQGKAQA